MKKNDIYEEDYYGMTGGTKKKSRWWIALLIFFFVILLICSLVATYIAASGSDMANSPSIFGYRLYYTTDAGKAILTKDTSSYAKGDPVAIISGEGASKTASVTYVLADNGDGTFITADADGSNQVVMGGEKIKGAAVSYIDGLGSMLKIIKSTYGLIMSAALSVFLAAMIILLISSFKRRGRKPITDEDLDLEGDTPGGSDMEEKRDDGELLLGDEKRQDDGRNRDTMRNVGTIDLEAEREQRADGADKDRPAAHDEVPQKEDVRTDKPAVAGDREKQASPSIPGGVVPETSMMSDFNGDWVEMNITGTEKQMELMAKLIDMGAKKSGSSSIVMDLAYGETTALRIRCMWDDVQLISKIVSGVKKRM